MHRLALPLLLLLLLVRPAVADGSVTFPASAIHRSDADAATTSSLRQAVTRSWDRWLHLDASGYGAWLAPDVTRMSQRGNGLQRGRAAVLAALPEEWSAFERPRGVVAESMGIRRADVHVEGSHAIITYWVETSGGARWSYDDLGLVWQAWTRGAGGRWQLVHQIDGWSLDYDIDHQIPGKPAFAFDFAYPVHDLRRAAAFYSGLLGPPEKVEEDRVTFILKGASLFLEQESDFARVRPGVPNGYAIIHVPDLDAERQRLTRAGVRFQPAVRRRGDDRSVVGFDPAGNAFVLWQRVFSGGLRTAASQIVGLDQPYARSARGVLDAWLRARPKELAPWLSPSTRWFDASESRTFGVETGGASILAVIDRHYWSHHDRDAKGLMLDATASSVAVRPLGRSTLVSFRLRLRGTGRHPSRVAALVTMLFSAPNRLQDLWMIEDSAAPTQAMEFDYSGYPQRDLEAANRFYSDVMRFGKPYRDSGYRGWWSAGAVFGVYRARPPRDPVPVEGRANGYMSFWVRSAAATYKWLQAHGARFPVIPAINTKTGIDEEPGFRQIYATDSEGNGIVLSEYTGKRR